MNGREEATKVKLFLYLIGSQGREIYDTMAFEVPASERTLTQVWAALFGHNPRKNETVESFKFFSRTQDPGESQEKIIADFKLLATTCNCWETGSFGEFRTSSFENNCLRSQILIYKDVSASVDWPSYWKHGLKRSARFAKEWIISHLNALLKREETSSNQIVRASSMNSASRSAQWMKVE